MGAKINLNEHLLNKCAVSAGPRDTPAEGGGGGRWTALRMEFKIKSDCSVGSGPRKGKSTETGKSQWLRGSNEVNSIIVVWRGCSAASAAAG